MNFRATFIIFMLIAASISLADLDFHQDVMSKKVSKDLKKASAKNDRMKKIVKIVEEFGFPTNLIPEAWCKPHNTSGPAIFAVSLKTTYSRANVLRFAGSAKTSGFQGDIVLAILPHSLTGLVEAVKEVNAITYMIMPECHGSGIAMVCKFIGQDDYFSVNMIRYYLYLWWSILYDNDALIMISDFRDVMFQSNPFIYRTFQWAPPAYQLVVFQEAYPNKVIYRCPFNRAYLEKCYGKKSIVKIGSNTVLCAGVTMGTRDAMLVYNYFMIQQLNAKNRGIIRAENSTSPDNCVSPGMDQGFHNWLIYSGQLESFMNVKIFQQGEGPVNTVGSLIGRHSLFNFTFEDLKVLRGNSPHRYFHNWNGDVSPVVHQYDRLPLTEVPGGFGKHFGALRAAFKDAISDTTSSFVKS